MVSYSVFHCFHHFYVGKVDSQCFSQGGALCIGLDDHLPYEMTMKDGGRYSYSDYNRALQIEAPEAVLQPASSTDGSN